MDIIAPSQQDEDWFAESQNLTSSESDVVEDDVKDEKDEGKCFRNFIQLELYIMKRSTRGYSRRV